MVKGIETSVKPCVHGHGLCDACVRGKQTKESYPATPYQATRRLQLLHTDIVGELLVEGAEGEKYLLTLLDDYSRAYEVRDCKLTRPCSCKGNYYALGNPNKTYSSSG